MLRKKKKRKWWKEKNRVCGEDFLMSKEGKTTRRDATRRDMSRYRQAAETSAG